ncbi:phage tail protein [Enterobacter ludwigii]
MSDYYILITNAGSAREAEAHAKGESVNLSHFGICDGGVDFVPDPAATTFKNEVYRGGISSLTVSNIDDTVLIAQCIIPAASGGYTVRGIAIYTDDGLLYATGNYPSQEKPLPETGFSASLEINAEMAVSHTSDITLVVPDDAFMTPDMADVLYLRQDKHLAEIAARGAAAQAASRKNIGCGTAATYNAEDFLPADYKPPASGVSSVNGKTGAVQLGAGDVGAVAVTGGTMTGELVINVDDGAIRLKTKSTSAASFIRCTDSTNANHWYIGVGSKYSTEATFQNYKGGNNSIILKGDGAVAINPMNGKSATVNGPLQVGTTGSAALNIGDADSGLRNARDGQIDLWANNKAVGSWNGTAFSFTGQMIPTDYANFDARYQLKAASSGVQDIQLGAEYSKDYGGGSIVRANAGGVLTGLREEQGDNEIHAYYFKPIQKFINGTWVTISG